MSTSASTTSTTSVFLSIVDTSSTSVTSATYTTSSTTSSIPVATASDLSTTSEATTTITATASDLSTNSEATTTFTMPPPQPPALSTDPPPSGSFIPNFLRVQAPNGPVGCEGLYQVLSDTANGNPIWKHVSADRWIYTMRSGRWGLGGLNEAMMKFDTDIAFMFCDDFSGSRMPNELACNSHSLTDRQFMGGALNWQRWAGNTWEEDADIQISIGEELGSQDTQEPSQGLVPKYISVEAPNGPPLCAGVYELIEGQMPFDRPLWKHVSENLWIYFMRSGRWGIGGADVRAQDFQSDVAYMFCGTRAGNKMPTEQKCTWSRWDGSTWIMDGDLSLTPTEASPIQSPVGEPGTASPGQTKAIVTSIAKQNGFPGAVAALIFAVCCGMA